MPVIVIGADAGPGGEIVAGLLDPDREVRAFVSDIAAADTLRRSGVKVALGDVSDESHVQGAALNCFTAVLIMAAATDARERSFAGDPDQVLDGWAAAVEAAGVTRVIWVGEGEMRPTATRESTMVSSSHPSLVERVVDLDSARTIS